MITRSSIEVSLWEAVWSSGAICSYICSECVEKVLNGNARKCNAAFDPEIPQCYYHSVIGDINTVISQASDKIYELLP